MAGLLTSSKPQPSHPL